MKFSYTKSKKRDSQCCTASFVNAAYFQTAPVICNSEIKIKEFVNKFLQVVCYKKYLVYQFSVFAPANFLDSDMLDEKLSIGSVNGTSECRKSKA